MSQPVPRTPVSRAAAVVKAVAAVVGLEVLALAGVVVYYGVELTRAAATDAVGAVATAVLAGAAATGLALCARALLSGRRWARAPLLTWQLFQIVLVAPLVRGPLWWAAAPLVLLSLAAGVALVTRAVAQAVGDDDTAPPLP